MKLAAMVVTAAMAVMSGAGAQAQAKSATGRLVTVYCYDNADKAVVPYRIEVQAQDLASKMFANIGVTLHWRPGSPSRSKAGSMTIEFVTGTPDTFMPGSLAYALPYEGVHICIFWDRINASPAPRELLAHVMVHEVAHILQGGPWHSDEGIMKARWTPGDLYTMKMKPLTFSPEDVNLIYKGLDNREARTMTAAAAKPGE